jgi:hypothetical protein
MLVRNWWIIHPVVGSGAGWKYLTMLKFKGTFRVMESKHVVRKARK